MQVGHHHAAEDADDVGEEDHQRQGDHQRDDARQHQEPLRLEAHDAHGVDLLGDLHHPQLGGVGGAGAARHHDGGDERRQFPRHRDTDHVHDEDVGAELLQLHRPLVGDDHPDEEAGEGDDGQGAHARVLDVLGDGVETDGERVHQGVRQHHEVLAQEFQEESQVPGAVERAASQPGQGAEQTAAQGSRPRSGLGKMAQQQRFELLLLLAASGDRLAAAAPGQFVAVVEVEHHARRVHLGDAGEVPGDGCAVQPAGRLLQGLDHGVEPVRRPSPRGVQQPLPAFPFQAQPGRRLFRFRDGSLDLAGGHAVPRKAPSFLFRFSLSRERAPQNRAPPVVVRRAAGRPFRGALLRVPALCERLFSSPAGRGRREVDGS